MALELFCLTLLDECVKSCLAGDKYMKLGNRGLKKIPPLKTQEGFVKQANIVGVARLWELAPPKSQQRPRIATSTAQFPVATSA